MDFLYRTKPPTYKGAGQVKQTTTTTRPGFLAGIWCSVFGGLFTRSAPTYRTIGTSPSTALGCGSPRYVTPPEVPGDPCPESSPTSGEPTGEDCPCDPEPYGEAREIHIYPGG